MSVLWSGPGRALQAHLDLFAKVQRTERWMREHHGEAVALDVMPPLLRQRIKLMTSMADHVTVDGETVAINRDDESRWRERVGRGVGLVSREYESLNRGETHYVSHNISETMWTIAESAEDEPLFPTDVPCPNGLLVFEHPLFLNDLHPETGLTVEGLTMPIRAIAWSVVDGIYTMRPGTDGTETRPGLHYVSYTDAGSFSAYYMPSFQRLVGRPAAEDVDADDLGMWVCDTSAWCFGASWRRGGDVHTIGEVVHDNVALIRRFLLALWRFQWQRILVPTIYKPSRPELRRAQRIRPLEDGYVKVLRLRRIVEAEARGERIEGEGFLLTAHLRRGHWHRTHYATLGPARLEDGSWNPESHRLTWREPTIVGEGPLVLGHNVTAVVR